MRLRSVIVALYKPESNVVEMPREKEKIVKLQREKSETEISSQVIQVNSLHSGKYIQNLSKKIESI